ncbi:hypothetical protein SAMN06265795_103154 [Noviherbaspirillum humi]|uniref:Uncharacterized protein n=1 Tax=Noviherbaspirillum humi TaxID=1688639 RepID=A0A239F344_9BURK|nr:hypothetical protein [Noviherbaspirillum humi]SNS51309.1 hypothetical protein SAMN06265795_103154 [Noviherbaspirillum humi]
MPKKATLRARMPFVLPFFRLQPIGRVLMRIGNLRVADDGMRAMREDRRGAS